VSQTKYTISGYISEKGSKENLPGVTVYQLNTNFSTVSNLYGFFSITLPACDTMKLAVSFLGYQTQIVELKHNKNQSIDISMQSNLTLDEVEVVAKKTEAISEDVQMSRIDIPVEKIKDIPALLGEKDVLKVLQLMPGVQKGNEGSSGFYVRGGGPDQNLIILDDATVYNAFHLFGFFSLFNGDALKSIELVKGGFPARYGGRLSSVLDMQMKDGNKEKIKGEAGIGIISSRFTIEGPIIKDKCSFLVSGRRTYIDALIYPFMPKDRKGGYFFYDFNAKVNYVLSKKDRLYMSGYFGQDKFYANIKDDNSTTTAGLDWGNTTTTARWNHLFSDKLFLNTSFIFTDYNLKITAGSKDNFSDFSLMYTSGIRDYAIKTSFDYMPNPQHYVKFGLQSIYHRFSPGASVIKGSYLSETKSKSKIYEAFESGIFIEDDWKINRAWRVNYGGRISNFIIGDENYINPEPRASLRYLIKKDLSFKASYALMNQYMHLLSNTGIGLPTDLWVPATKKAPYMQSQQAAAGFSKDFLKKGFDVSLEGYYKEMNHVLGYKEGASFLTVGSGEGQTISWEDNVTSGKGWSYGGELLIRKNTGKFTGWIGYTLSWTQLQFNDLNFGKKFYARYDRRHDISVVGVYEINKNIKLSATWVYGTGNAITLPLNSYLASVYTNPYSPNNPLAINQASYYNVQDYGTQRNAFRMGAYHRADLGIQFVKEHPKYSRVFELSFYNVYNRQNPFFYYIDTDINGKQELMQVSLFPIIPSVSWSFKF
jgi:hypothetical protein